MTDLTLGLDAFDTNGNYVNDANRKRYHQVRSDLGLSLTPTVNRNGTITVASNVVGTNNAGASNILFHLNGNVVSLDNLTTPTAQTGNPTTPSSSHNGGPNDHHENEIGALKQAKNGPTHSKSVG